MYGTVWRNKQLSSVKTGHIILGTEHNHHFLLYHYHFVHADVFYLGSVLLSLARKLNK